MMSMVSTSIVSIHAPAWGATRVIVAGLRAPDVSIHAPAWGATQVAHARPLLLEVSIHAPAWGATAWRVVRRASIAVSIHAPAWGATGIRRTAATPASGFNPRPRVGGDPPRPRIHSVATGFNPRPRVGGDGVAGPGLCLRPGFNPRPRVGGDSCLPTPLVAGPQEALRAKPRTSPPPSVAACGLRGLGWLYTAPEGDSRTILGVLCELYIRIRVTPPKGLQGRRCPWPQCAPRGVASSRPGSSTAGCPCLDR